MYQETTFYKGGTSHSVAALTVKERIELLFKGTLTITIDGNVRSSDGVVRCWYTPKITKSPSKKGRES